MGQAKLRGSVDNRIAQAKDRVESLRPKKMTCDQCKKDFSEFEVVSNKGMPGINAIFSGICPNCGSETVSFVGAHNAVIQAVSAYSKSFESEDECDNFGEEL